MNDLQQACNSLREVAAKFQGIFALANEVERLGSLEVLSSELEAKLATTQDAITASDAMLTRSFEKLEKVELEVEERRKSAEASAAAIIAKAVEDEEKLKAQFSEDKTTRTNQLSSIEKEIETRNKQLDALRSQIVEAEKTLEEWHLKTSAAKKALANLIKD